MQLFSESPTQRRNGSTLNGDGFGGCALRGISLSNNKNLSNLGMASSERAIERGLQVQGSILLSAIAIAVTIVLLLRSERKRAAVGRRFNNPTSTCKQLLTMCREFQLFLVGYIIVSLCEIFTVGGFPLDRAVRLVCVT